MLTVGCSRYVFFSAETAFGSRAGFVGVRGFLTIIVSLVGNELVQIA